VVKEVGAEEKEKAEKIEKGLVPPEKKEKKAPQKPSAPNWKKNKKEKPKPVYKTASELTAEAEEESTPTAPSAPVIIDMTGREVRYTTVDKITQKDDPTKLFAANKKPDSASKYAVPELYHNLKLLVELTEQDIHRLDKDRKSVELSVDQLSKEKSQLEHVVKQESEQIGRVEEMLTVIESAQARLEYVLFILSCLYATLVLFAGNWLLRRLHTSNGSKQSPTCTITSNKNALKNLGLFPLSFLSLF
jgi:tuftelin-interacting protein 11